MKPEKPDLYFHMLFRERLVSVLKYISCFVLGVLLYSVNSAFAQELASIEGKTRSSKGELLSGVTIQVKNTRIFTQSNREGVYLIEKVPVNSILIFSRLGYKTLVLELGLITNIRNIQDVILYEEIQSLDEVHITENFNGSNLQRLDVSKLKSFPQPSGNLESFIKNLPGVSANNELSSQYTVRGGNFDENLLYLNDIEIYRPLLVKKGQQEGLGFVNPDLAGDVRFSAGGFEARYGDKLSSVLDVRYNKPDSFSLEASIGFLGSSAALKVPFKNSYLLAGIRNKTNESLLSRQDIGGKYQSDFSDYQILYKQELSSRVALSLFGNYNKGDIQVIPDKRETEFGTSDDVLKLLVSFKGQESSASESLTGAMTLAYNVSNTLNLKWISSVNRIKESEDTDLLEWYTFSDRDGLNSGSSRSVVGRGSNQNFAANRLNSQVYNSELRIYKQLRSSFMEMGLRFQNDNIRDTINEFTALDTSGYSVPPSGQWMYSELTEEQHTIHINRLSGFFQNTFRLNPYLNLIAGLRANYNSFTRETLLSPRISLMYYPGNAEELLLRFSAGAYAQPPFYRELRNFNGSINANARAQRSYQLLSGMDYMFNGLGTRLKFTSEIYYKFLYRLTPYKIDNLNIRYFSDKTSKGYAAGADLNLSGNFTKDLESSLRMSFMSTKEDIQNDSYPGRDAAGNPVIVRPGFLRRPTDQLMNIGLYFQDRLLQNPTYKVHLNLLYASSLPLGSPGMNIYPETFKIPAYKRVDIGFSKDFADTESKRISPFIRKYFQSLSLHTEIFNLLNIKNTVSFLWISDRNNIQYAVPNYLTYRKLNIRLSAKLKSR